MNKSFLALRRLLRGNFRLLTSYLKANWRLFVISLVIGSVSIYSFPHLQKFLEFKHPQTIGIVGNTTLSRLPIDIQREISFGLTKLTEDGQATTGAAISWEATNSGKTIRFNLNKDLFWQDGTKFDATQINYNLKGVDVRRLSLYSLDFNFQEPFAPLPTIISQPIFKTGLIGLGSNKVQNIKYNGRFLSSLSLYNVNSGETHIYKFFPSEAVAADALRLGLIDQLRSVHQSFNFGRDPHYQITSATSSATIAVIYLNLRKDPFSDKTFRQGLAYALPDNFPQGTPANSPIPTSSWAHSNSAKRYPQNVRQAKEDIAKIASQSSKLKITLTTSADLENVADIVAKSWSEAGLPTDINVSEVQPSDFDAYLTYLPLPPDPDQYAFWHSTQSGNISGYKSFKVDHLLEDGRRTFDLTARKDIYSNLEKAITEDSPALFLYYPTLYTIKRV